MKMIDDFLIGARLLARLLAVTARERDSALSQLVKAQSENAEMVRVCDSYAAENQRLFDRAEAASTRLAKARETLEWLNRRGGLGYDAHDRIRTALTDDIGKTDQ